MKYKIIGIVICMLLIFSTTSLAVTPLSKDKQQKKKQFFDTTTILLPTPTGWMKTFGGTENASGRSVQQTSDGGYIIAGYLGDDVWLIKTDANGNRLWDKTFGGKNRDIGSSVQQTTDEGYIITGTTRSFGAGTEDVWLIKTDNNGNKVWDKTFGETTSSDRGNSIDQTSDGGYIITGDTYSHGAEGQNVWLIKTDGNGNKIWDRTFGGTKDDMGCSGQQTTDGGYIITGDTCSFGNSICDVWLIKTDGNGDMIWNRTLGGEYGGHGRSVQQTTDNGYILVGYQYTDKFDHADILLIKTDSNGDKMWDRIFGRNGYNMGNSVQQTNDGGYIITGVTGLAYSPNGYPEFGDVLLIKTDENGKKIWWKTFRGTDYKVGWSVQQTIDGGYIITGRTRLHGASLIDVLLIKTDCQGRSKTTTLNNMRFERLYQRFPNMFPLL